jgi:hypothetical protein
MEVDVVELRRGDGVVDAHGCCKVAAGEGSSLEVTKDCLGRLETDCSRVKIGEA